MKTAFLAALALVSAPALPAPAALECAQGSLLAREGERLFCQGFCLQAVTQTGPARYVVEHQEFPGGPFVSRTLKFPSAWAGRRAEDAMLDVVRGNRFAPGCPYNPHFVRYVGLFPQAAFQWDERLYDARGPRFRDPAKLPLEIGASVDSGCAAGSHAILREDHAECVSACRIEVSREDRNVANGMGYSPVYETYTYVRVVSARAEKPPFENYEISRTLAERGAFLMSDEETERTVREFQSSLKDLCSSFSR